MPMIREKTEIITRLEKKMEEGKKVILFNYPDMETLLLFDKYLGSMKYTNIEIWQSLDSGIISGNVKYCLASEMMELLDLYNTYDFSNKISNVSHTTQYGSLFNYLKMGIMSEEEIIAAIQKGL